MMRLILLVLLLFLSFACGPSGAPVTPDPPPATPTRLDPWAAAERWAADLDAARASSPEAAAALDGWARAHVLRVWRDGETWRALIAPEPDADSGPAALLTITDSDGGASVTGASPASPTDLWPSI